MLEFFELLNAAKKFPDQVRGAVAEVAESVGLTTFPKIYAIAKKVDGGWQLVAVSLEPATLPEPAGDEFRLEGRLDKPKKPDETG